MKKLLIIPFIFLSIFGYSQMNTFGGIGLRVNDTTTYQTNAAAYHTAGYYDIYFNNQATNDHWDVWNGSSYDHIFSFSSAVAASFIWGTGTGTLSDQTDLQTALDAKEDLLETVSASTAGGTITLDFTNDTQKIFVGDATFSTGKAVAFSNATNAEVFDFHFEVTNVAGTLNFPANVQMFDEGWDVGTTTWTPPATGEYEIAGSYDGTNWRIKRIGPYDTTPTSGTPGGADTQVQYNDGGAFNGEADFTYNETTNTVTVDNLAVDTEAYGDTEWNGDLTVPTKDAVRDVISANSIAYVPADELTEVAGLTLEGDITRAALLSALGQQFLLCAIHSDANASITLTAHTNAVQVFPLGTSNHYQRVDLTDIAYLKLVARVITVSASANNPRLYIQYSITNGSSYTTLGAGTIASGDVVSLFTGTAGTAESNWITIPGEARIPGVWLRVVSDGGNSSASPVVGHVQILAKY